mgnify:FL=1|jgi:excinuclease UvrABC nuclease subunit
MTEISWSDWLDYNQDEISKTPQEPGIYMMHAAMKILYIGNTSNLRESILESMNNSCIKESKRFRYFLTPNFKELGHNILKEYQEKHDGKLPRCME